MKEIINKVESSEWEKIIANKITDKELISKIYKQHIQLDTKTNKQTNKQIKKWAKELNIFVQRRHTEKCQSKL